MLNMRPIKTLQIYFLFSLIAISSPLRTENLADVYELALKNDPLLKAAEATYRAGKENRTQGIAGLLPTLSVGGSTNCCLLYTSPSPRDLSTSRMPSSA